MKIKILLMCLILLTATLLQSKADRRSEKKRAIEFTAFGGACKSQFNFSAPSTPAATGETDETTAQIPLVIPDYTALMSFTAGAGIHVPLNKNFSFEFSLAYKRLKTEIPAYADPPPENFPETLDYVSLTSIIRFRIPMGAAKLYPLAGVEGSLLLSEANDVALDPVEKFNSIDLRLIAGAGIRVKMIAVEFRYCYGLLNLNHVRNPQVDVKTRGIELLVLLYLKAGG